MAKSIAPGFAAYGYPAMLAHNGPVGNSAYAIYRSGLKQASLCPRCGLVLLGANTARG